MPRWSEAITYSLIPEIDLPQGVHSDSYDIALGPQWKVAWPGGQGLARYLLDHPGEISGRSALDLGCGGGVASIAACMAGARRLIAVDKDEQALSACRSNLQRQGFAAPEHAIELCKVTDLTDFRPEVEILLLSEVLYTAGLRAAIIPWILSMLEAGCTMLLGERVQEGLDALPLELAARYEVTGKNLAGRPKSYSAFVWRAEG